MEKEREKKLREIVGGSILEITTEASNSKVILIIIDNNKDEVMQRKLNADGFLFFSPRELSEAAIENMQNWDEERKMGYDAALLKPTLMIVDPTQKEKSELLAKKIIGFYTSKAINYNIFNKSYARCNEDDISAFDGIGELDDILSKVGFTVQKFDDSNKITVNGDGFSLTVDVRNGEITKNIDTSVQDTIIKTSRNIGCPKPVRVEKIEKIYASGKPGIRAFVNSFLNARRNSR